MPTESPDLVNPGPMVEEILGGMGAYAPVPAATSQTTIQSTTLPTSSASVDWNAFAVKAFNFASPPTPESFAPAPHVEPTVSCEDSMPYRPPEEHEEQDEEGEILIGMGLYDNPEKDDIDTELDNYRSTTSHLLGTTRCKMLKLLEAWEPPPASDDGDEEEDEKDEKSSQGN